MSKNTIDYKKINELEQQISFCKESVLSNIEKINGQIEVLSEVYKDETTVQIYDLLVNQKLVSLKQGCNKMDKINEILNNVILAYKDLDERMASKVLKNNE